MNLRLLTRAIVLLLVIAAVFLFQNSGREADLAVAVASDFGEPAKAIARAFEKKTGLTVSIATSSTGKHYAQIRNGAPFDVFLAADSKRPELLENEGIAVSEIDSPTPGTHIFDAVDPEGNRFFVNRH
ncbi:substrate-binding domain-containing protein [Verrucomicrobiales bacterium]|nr:substrate-binding domain-containing protein [Verrucomicrobiales bacterium]